MPDRTFRTEHRRLRGLLRREGLDPYEPAQPFVSVGERYRLRRKPRVSDLANLVARLFEDSLRVRPSPGAIAGIDAPAPVGALSPETPPCWSNRAALDALK